MPPVDRQHEGFGFLRRREGAGNFGMTMGGILLRLDWEPLRERTLDHRRACEGTKQLRRRIALAMK